MLIERRLEKKGRMVIDQQELDKDQCVSEIKGKEKSLRVANSKLN